MCELAVQSQFPCLNHIPVAFLTQEICEIAVRENGENVKWVPDKFMSTALAWLAITSPAPSHPSNDMCASNIQYIKAQFLTKDIIVDSAKRWYSAYSKVPKECRTEEVDEAVLNVAPYCIKDMEQTPERCMKAIKKYPYLLSDCIEIKNITREMVEYMESLPNKVKMSIKKFFKPEDLKYVMTLL